MYLHFKYGQKTPSVETQPDGLSVCIANPSLGEAIESWDLPDGSQVQHGDFQCLQSDSCIVGAVTLPVSPDTLEALSEKLYQQILKQHPSYSLYRIWHFIPQINEKPPGKIENYQTFCKGRSQAFEQLSQETVLATVPAAAAVGTSGNHLTIVYLAGKAPGTPIENPRQIPAYNYPEKYGPKPPMFARGTSVQQTDLHKLFISGTSSVLGTESVGDTIEEQLKVTIENLKIVADEYETSASGLRRVRIYLRHAKDYAYVKAELERNYLNEGDKAYFILADICRAELLVEIETTILSSSDQ